jgi:DNA/RNA-binding domain of Phe-tRNA-synthetase-like protein
MNEEVELAAAAGFVEPHLREEFPGLRLDWCSVEGRLRDSPREVRARLAQMSNRWRGANVVAMRTQPVPHAYRAFFRQTGLDPDANRIPLEAAAVARLLHGEFRSRNILEDALLIALVETGVPVWALDTDHVDPGGPGIRTTVPGDRLGSGPDGDDLAPGRLVVADAHAVHALLFDEVTREHAVTARTARITLFAVGVGGVPAIHVEESLWLCVEALSGR